MGANPEKNNKEPVSIETIEAVVESQSKNTEQLVLIATSIHDLSECSKVIKDKLSNGIKDEIAAKVVDSIKNSEMAQDIKHTKWIFGIITVVTIIVMVLTKVINNEPLVTIKRQQAVAQTQAQTLMELTEEIEIMRKELKQHEKRTKEDERVNKE